MAGEIRIPTKLLSSALSEKKVKQLRFFACAKLKGHRVCVDVLADDLDIHPKTCKRIIKSILTDGWAGYDGKHLFPRSWRKMRLNKRSGLYITEPYNLKKFEALCFAKALKKLYRKLGGQRPNRRRTVQTDLPARYISKALGLSERRFERLKSDAQRYRFISVKRQYTVIGSVKDYGALRKHLHGLPIFKRGKHCVVPDVSKIKVLI